MGEAMGDAMAEHDANMLPVYQALDAAMRAGLDIEAVQESVNAHLNWWADHLHAEAEQ